MRLANQQLATAKVLLTATVMIVALVPGCAFDSEQASPSPESSASATESASPAASPTTSSPRDSDSSDSALAAVDLLIVKGRGPKTGYDRENFGDGWGDLDGDGCDTRNELLQEQLTEITLDDDCRVTSGVLLDPFTGQSIRFQYGGTSEVDVDHMVALSDAWQKGAAQWSTDKRVVFANDPLNLQPTDAAANRQKGDGDTATWLPPNTSYRCTYVARQVAVKVKYDLSVTEAERDAMIRVLSECPDEILPR